MNSHEISKRSYILLWLNSATSTLMAQYMMYRGFFLPVYIFPWVCSAFAYHYGYRYARTGREVSRKPYLVLLSVYAGIFAIPPMTRMFWLHFHPILFAYECGRLLAFRAVWLKKHFEAYLHLLVYSLIAFSCLVHERADFTLIIFIPFHVAALLLALYSLYCDGEKQSSSRFPLISLVQGFLGILFISILLCALLPATKLWNFELIPDKIGNVTFGDHGNPIDRAMKYLSTKKLTANPESKLGDWLLKKMQGAYEDFQRIQQYVERHLHTFYINLKFLLLWFIAWAILFLLWKFRHFIFLVFSVLFIDPMRISFISEKKDSEKRDVFLLYGAYERLWHYKGIKRELSMAPLEHLFAIAKESKDMVKPSMKITQTFQSVRYGEKQATGLNIEIKDYLLLRNTVSPNISRLFGKQFNPPK